MTSNPQNADRGPTDGTFESTESRLIPNVGDTTQSVSASVDAATSVTALENAGYHAGHVAPQLLRVYKGGRAPRRLVDAIDRHLVGCPICRKNLLQARLAPTEIGRPNAEVLVPDEPKGAHRQLGEELRDHPDLLFEGWLGAGGMGSVFLARQRLLDRRVAVKLLHPRLYDRPDSGRRLQNEIRAVAKLDHPQVVAAYTAELYRGRLLFIMEHVDGASLHDYLAAVGSLPAAEACDYVRQAALGLQHAHDAGLVHRDVKPQNLILTPQGRIKILDFGLARAKDRDSSTRTGPGTMMGTADYVAPEQALNAAAADARSDLYSLGCTLYHALAGQVPFPDATPTEKIARHVGEQPADLSALRPDLPPGLCAVVRKLMAKDRSRRYQSAAEVVEALAPYVPDRPRQGRWTRRRVLAVTAGAVVAVAAGGLVSGAGQRLLRRNLPRVFPPRMGDLLMELGAEDNFVTTAFSPDGKTLIAGGNSATLFAWNGETGERLWQRREHTDRINHTAFSPDGQWVATVADDRRLLLWDTATWQVRWRPPLFEEGAEAAGFSSSSKVAYAADGAGHMIALDLASGTMLTTWRPPDFNAYGKGIAAIVATADGKSLFLGLGVWHDLPTTDPADGLVLMVDAATGAIRSKLTGQTASIISLSLSPDGTHLAAAGLDGLIHIWDTNSLQVIQTFTGHEHIARAVAFAPDGRRLASSSFDGTVRLWELERAEPLAFFSSPGSSRFNHLSFSSDGTRLAGAGRSEVAVWAIR